MLARGAPSILAVVELPTFALLDRIADKRGESVERARHARALIPRRILARERVPARHGDRRVGRLVLRGIGQEQMCRHVVVRARLHQHLLDEVAVALHTPRHLRVERRFLRESAERSDRLRAHFGLARLERLRRLARGPGGVLRAVQAHGLVEGGVVNRLRESVGVELYERRRKRKHRKCNKICHGSFSFISSASSSSSREP